MNEELWLSFRLPDLPWVVVHGANEPCDVIVFDGYYVASCTRIAQHKGIYRGMKKSAALTLSPDSKIYERNIAEEEQLLKKLSDDLYHYSPYIQCHDSQIASNKGLQIEVSRCLKLFNGFESLWQKIRRTVQLDMQYHNDTACLWGVAHTPEASWLLTYAEQHLEPEEMVQDKYFYLMRLQFCPISCLLDFPRDVKKLKSMGFKSLNNVADHLKAHGISSFKKRFSQPLCHFLQNIFYIEQDYYHDTLFRRPKISYHPDVHFRQKIQFDHPVKTLSLLSEGMTCLLQQLSEFLVKHQQQCHEIHWHCYDFNKHHYQFSIRCSYIHQRYQLPLDLTQIYLEKKGLPFPVDTLALVVDTLLPLQQSQAKLAIHDVAVLSDDALEKSLSKLRVRLGEAAVWQLAMKDSHVPENTVQLKPIHSVPVAQTVTMADQYTYAWRPPWLFSSPKKLVCQRGQLVWNGMLRVIYGPERLQTQWWDTDLQRDYYIAERYDHRFFWIYQDLNNQQWWLHGVFL